MHLKLFGAVPLAVLTVVWSQDYCGGLKSHCLINDYKLIQRLDWLDYPYMVPNNQLKHP